MQSCFRAHSCAFSLCLSVFLWSHKDQRGELRFTWTHRFHRFLDGSFKSKGARWVCRAPPAVAHRSRWGAHTIWSPSNSAQRKRNTKILGKGGINRLFSHTSILRDGNSDHEAPKLSARSTYNHSGTKEGGKAETITLLCSNILDLLMFSITN